jgi:hypothetical protein
MPERTAKFVFAVVVNILACIPLATMTRGETAAADGCLSGPKAETPPGSHWYYRIDHANKRNCWYLRSDGSGVSQTAPQNTPPVPSPPSPAKPSVADARAEFRARTSREDSPPATTPASAIWPAVPETATAAVATRWPELAATGSISNGASGPAANPSGNPPQAAAGLPKTAATSALTASLAPVQPGTIPTLIAAAVGALVFIGIAAALVSRRGHARRLRRRKAVHARGPIWETTDDDRIVLSDPLPSGSRDYRPRFARGAASAKVQGAKVQADRKTEFISRMPRRRAPR